MRTKLFNFIFSLLTSLIYLMPSNLTAQTKPDIEKLDDAVVLVMIYDYQGNFVGHGSGFIIDNKGTTIKQLNRNEAGNIEFEILVILY